MLLPRRNAITSDTLILLALTVLAILGWSGSAAAQCSHLPCRPGDQYNRDKGWCEEGGFVVGTRLRTSYPTCREDEHFNAERGVCGLKACIYNLCVATS
jgi:hypothetical protein